MFVILIRLVQILVFMCFHSFDNVVYFAVTSSMLKVFTYNRIIFQINFMLLFLTILMSNVSKCFPELYTPKNLRKVLTNVHT